MEMNKRERIEWLKSEYEKAENEGRIEDMDLIAEQLENKECFIDI